MVFLNPEPVFDLPYVFLFDLPYVLPYDHPYGLPYGVLHGFLGWWMDDQISNSCCIYGTLIDTLHDTLDMMHYMVHNIEYMTYDTLFGIFYGTLQMVQYAWYIYSHTDKH